MDAFVMLQELLEQDQFELILPDEKECKQQEEVRQQDRRKSRISAWSIL